MAAIANAFPQRPSRRLGVILCRFHYPLASPDARLMHPRFIETLAMVGLFPEILKVVHAYAGEDLPSLADAPAWIVSGEPFATERDTPWIEELSDFLRLAAAVGIPLYGTGGGERVLATVFGGPRSELDTPLEPNVRNPLYGFRAADRLYRLLPATRSVTACPAPHHYRRPLSLRNAAASAGVLARRLVPARALS